MYVRGVSSARPRHAVAHAVRPAVGRGQDRAVCVRAVDGVVLAVADGSGGMRGGAQAADRGIQCVIDYARNPTGDAEEWARLIATIDAAASSESGQCALVIAAVMEDAIVGASAGDCGAWLIHDGIDDLTEQQVRKPLVGSGSAVPIPFRRSLGSGTLMLASDGLLKYGRRMDIANQCLHDDLDAVALGLTELPRLRSGDVPDDVAVVLCRASVLR
jgi:hypothetical protein